MSRQLFRKILIALRNCNDYLVWTFADTKPDDHVKDGENLMGTSKKSTVDVQSTAANIVRSGNEDFTSMTDILKARDGEFFMSDWLRNTAMFSAIRGSVFNPAFNYGEFVIITTKAGLNSYKISSNDSHPDMWFRPEFKPVDFERFRTKAGSDRLKRLNQISIRQMQTFFLGFIRLLLAGTGKEGKA